MKRPLADTFIIGFFLAMIALVVSRFFWWHPTESEQLNFLAATLSDLGAELTQWHGQFPGMAVLFKLFATAVPGSKLEAGPRFMFFIEMFTLSATAVFIYRRYGFSCSLVFLTFAISSFFTFFSATQMWPQSVFTLFAILSTGSLILFQKHLQTQWLLAAAVFTAIAIASYFPGILFLVGAIYLLSQNSERKPWKSHIGIFLITVVLTLAFIHLVFVGLFGLPALKAIYSNTTFSMIESKGVLNFWDAFLDRLYFPVFLSALLLIDAYFNTRARTFVFLGWVLFLAAFLHGNFFENADFIKPQTLYPCYLFFLISASLAFGPYVILPSSHARLRSAVLLIGLWCLGFLWMRESDPTLIFKSGYSPQITGLQKLVLNGTLMIFIPSLIISYLTKRRGAALLSLALIGFWGGAYSVSTAHHMFQSQLVPQTREYENYAYLLENINNIEFDVYLPEISSTLDIAKLNLYRRAFFNPNPVNFLRDESFLLSKTYDNAVLVSTDFVSSKNLYSFKIMHSFFYNGKSYSVIASP